MNFNTVKVLLLGPTKSGKSSLANFISDAKENPVGEYRPTAACRILEFQLDSPSISKGSSNRDIQIWDCGGDSKYQSCWPALAHETQAVLLVYDASKEEQATELESIYNGWANLLELSPARFLVVARKWGEGQANRNRSLRLGTLSRLSRVEWDIDLEGPKVRTEFASFVSSILVDVRRKREEEEITILKE